MTSSPVNGLMSPSRTSRRKEKRNPSVTPRRFGRFFTPRSSLSLSLPTSRRILGSLDSSAVNRQPLSPQSIFSDPLASDPLSPSPTRRLGNDEDENESRKRKWHNEEGTVTKRRVFLSNDMPPPPLNLPTQSSQVSQDADASISGNAPVVQDSQEDLADRRKATLSQFFKASRGGARSLKDKPILDDFPAVSGISKASPTLEGYEPTPIRKLANRGFEPQLLNREHGFSSHTGRRHLAFPAADPRTETASFYSRSSDVHQVTAHDRQGNTIPFSLASCHNASVTAIGDEEGFVRFFNTIMTSNPTESKVDAHFKVHDNAIMDVAFSEDDMRLATACGDRTGKIVDTATQTVAVELNAGHWDSLRQISFQPGTSGGNTLATSDRAGRIQVWDLRCSAAPINNFSTRGPLGLAPRDSNLHPFAARTINTLDNAHERTVQGNTSAASVTAIQWFPAGREHLLLSASEANASIKLWDTRYIKPRRQAEETPLAVTLEPATHAWRSYGITSLALSSDSARLYAVCKDSTVYAYSTAHLMLGHSPELVDGAAKRRPAGVEGLGPLYGFKHDQFRAQSFYVKCAIRPSRNSHTSELLAVGSSDSCAVLFPTDERYLHAASAQRAHNLEPPAAATPSQSFSSSFSAAPASSPIPIFRTGTPLVRGHSREVTTLSWVHDGKLVTASDDFVVRQWQQGDGSARHLRQVGEFGGERHMAGWADVAADWDEEDDDEE
ncbi:WD domain protein [Ilyonectria robusta]|uniref:WD domain protein n=1 Tax=Ilyonectria robusta TaxID=1079257 RepID=UPI001E8EE32D|nr:WD domain protein [Ilyonectria robusta]KAH8733714.1 WD domain protein [Ilyonectria robusta]